MNDKDRLDHEREVNKYALDLALRYVLPRDNDEDILKRAGAYREFLMGSQREIE